MNIIKSKKKSILGLPVAPQSSSQQDRFLRAQKGKRGKGKSAKPPAPPCMASRQAREAQRVENLRTPKGADFEMMCANYHNLKDWPENW